MQTQYRGPLLILDLQVACPVKSRVESTVGGDSQALRGIRGCRDWHGQVKGIQQSKEV
jgi:hypothetical protein